jgi:hypothetical protein
MLAAEYECWLAIADVGWRVCAGQATIINTESNTFAQPIQIQFSSMLPRHTNPVAHGNRNRSKLAMLNVGSTNHNLCPGSALVTRVLAPPLPTGVDHHKRIAFGCKHDVPAQSVTKMGADPKGRAKIRERDGGVSEYLSRMVPK